MDMVQTFSRTIRVQRPEKFILSGISKRGWTTFLASAIDNKRVIGFIPIVYDLIDINKVYINCLWNYLENCKVK